MSTNRSLIIALEIAMMECDTEPEFREMLTKEKEKALKKIGWNPDKKIKITNRGQFKTSSPFQKCCKDYHKVIDYAYDYFFGDEAKKKDLTVAECFEKQMEKFDYLCDKDAKSRESEMLYFQRFRKFFLDYPDNIDNPVGSFALGQLKIRDVSKSLLHEYLECIAADFHLTRAGLRDAKTPLSKAFQYAVIEDIIEYNPVTVIDTSDIYTFDNKSDLTAYTDEEVRKLLDVMTDETVLSSYRKGSLAREAAAALCYETQITVRAGETRALRVSDVCLDEGQESASITAFIRRTRDKDGNRIFIYRPVTKAKSRKGDRSPALSDFAVQIILQQIERHPDDEYVFSSNGKPLPENCLQQWLQRFCKIAGIEYRRPHCLRCTTITQEREAGISKNRIQHSAGHLSPKTTDGYFDTSRSAEITKEEANRIFVKPSATSCYQNFKIV